MEIASGVAPGLALSEHGPCLAGGTVTLDDVSLTTKFAIHSGGDVTQVRGAPRYGFPPNLPPTSRLGTYAFGSGIYLIRAGGLNAPSSPLPGVGLGGLVPRTESAVLGELPFTSADYCDFRTHGPHIRIDDGSAPSGRFVTRVSASVTTVDRCLGRGRTLLAADNDSPRSSPYPPRSARAPQKPLLPRRPSPCLLYTSPSPRDRQKSRMPSSA